MPPITPSAYDYAFSHNRLSQLRSELKLTQAEMAELLDVPVNTLSRWENGRTTPDAHALAALYSIARERDVEPVFFERRASPLAIRKNRTNLVLMWDFQNLAIDADSLEVELEWLDEILDLMYPHIPEENCTFIAYTSYNHSAAFQKLRNDGFIVKQTYANADRQLITDAEKIFSLPPESVRRSQGTDTLQQIYGSIVPRFIIVGSDLPTCNFDETTFILVADDGDYAPLLSELIDAGVEVRLWATEEVSGRLKSAVNAEHFIHWDKPYVVGRCHEVIRELEGRPISPSQFGNVCKKALDEDGYDISPADAGFSRNSQYMSVLRWMERQGLVRVRRTGKGKSQKIAITPMNGQ